ncbi:hypothetical protein ASPACDRAFT_56824 [Aspergillus aculeatus ATCC 16872]|uniref:Uncharacterized protein n=1 Tax=Aspergillus aculeatus (strain ATCC 16872 / CBS 172.66 / WB 5094) TaxID=690307 RepID=A0A1L9X4M0_ASPA1|nr:uncharacterized protein ASPACDRAFT_56824 [Aspergillus aculeatus ATCC 16872]OJK03413.1 hypothetical protein ASPACDRAFT_56824 [Aspergillus aculeatus ATCC 16872]
MSYLSPCTLNPPPGCINWDHQALHPPPWVLTILPPTTRELIDRCYLLAYSSLRVQRHVELCFAARYKSLCPGAFTSSSTDPSTNPTTPAAEPTPATASAAATTPDPNPDSDPDPNPQPKSGHNPVLLITHAQSIDRLFNWRRDYIPGNPTLAPSAKIPRSAVRFHVDRAAFAAYAARYTALLDMYLTTYYRRYREAVGAVERSIVLLRSGSGTGRNQGGEAGQGEGGRDGDKDTEKAREMRELDCRQLEWWWGTVFLREMMRWESRIPLLRMPAFEVVIGEVYEAVRGAVEEGEEEVVWEERGFGGYDLNCGR